jgi:hypothetical protein
MAHVTKSIDGDVHVLAIVSNGRVTLSHRVELVAQEDRVWLLVGLEQTINRDPKITGRLLILHGEIKDVVGNGAEHLVADVGVHHLPVHIIRGSGRRAVDVTKDAELATHGTEEGLPLGVIGVLQLVIGK